MLTLFLSGCGNFSTLGETKTSGQADPGPPRALKPALLRLEDVGPGGPYLDQENLHKLYTIAHYLHQEGVPFHVSLIPRIVVPKKNYDTVVSDDTPYARLFVATMKDIEKLGGVIGIHGYTHQTGTDPSGWGYEFYDPVLNPWAPNIYEFARDRIDRAILSMEKAGIRPAYWETPHYTASLKQYPAFEEQAGLLYENKHRGENAASHRVVDYTGQGYRGYVTIPAPLGNIDKDSDVEKMIKRLDHPGSELASFFYHPYREFKYLYKAYNNKGEVYYVYDRNSPLHVLINAFKDKGYTFVSVNSLVGFVPAHRLESVPFGDGGALIAGCFTGEGRKNLLVWDKGGRKWHMYDYTAAWHTPRRIRAFKDLGVPVDNWIPESDSLFMAGDFNGDKMEDLLVFSPGTGIFHLAENRSGRLFPRKIPLNVSGMGPVRPLAGDFNGDGRADVALHDPEKGRIGVALRGGVWGFRQVRWQSADFLKGEGQKALAGDFNGDGRDDIAVFDQRAGSWQVMIACHSGVVFAPDGAWSDIKETGGAWRHFASDVDGDGRDDLVLYSRAGRWQVALSDGCRFIKKNDFGPWGASLQGVPLVSDINGDGRSDLIIIDGSREKGYSLDTAISVMGG